MNLMDFENFKKITLQNAAKWIMLKWSQEATKIYINKIYKYRARFNLSQHKGAQEFINNTFLTAETLMRKGVS